MCRTDTLLFIAFVFYGYTHRTAWSYTFTDENNLRTSLFTGYNSDVRPETPTEVTVTMTLMSLNYLDIGAQEMCANIVIISEWTDSRLVWTPSSHNGIQALVVGYGTVWLPTLVIENTIDDAGLFGKDEAAPTRINPDGFVQWISPAYTRVSCSMTVTFFPFDRQSCFISVYGWAQNISEVSIRSSSVAWFLAQYTDNGEWGLQDTSVSEYLAREGPLTFRSLYFRVTFKRKWVFPFLTLIVPGVLNSILMCAVFYVPFEGVDKLGYSLTVLLSYYVLLTYVSDTLPATSTNISMLQAYLTFVMIAGTVSTLLSVWVVYIFYLDEDTPIPEWVSSIYDVSFIVLCHKGGCSRLSKLCRSCQGCGNKRTHQIRHSDVTRVGSDDAKIRHPGSGIATSLSSISPGSRSQPQFNTQIQREITADKIDPTLSPKGLLYQRNAALEEHDVKVKGRKINSEGAGVTAHETLSIEHNDAESISIKGLTQRNKNSGLGSKTHKNSVSLNQSHGKGTRRESCDIFVLDSTQISNASKDGDEDGDHDVERDNGDKEVVKMMKSLTWKMVAKRMDAVFFRIIGGLICVFTLILLIILLAHY